jgi:hypothetical protein
MTKRNFLPLLAMFLLAAGSLNAQISRPVKATIPFDFTAGSVDLPAGEYTVGMTGTLGNLLIRGEGTQGMFLGSQAVQANSRPAGSKLVFHRYGDRYFLSQIWAQGEERGSELPMTKVEKELRASNARPALVAVLAYK